MNSRHATRLLCLAVLAGAATAGVLVALYQSINSPVGSPNCRDVEILFARGTTEPPGLGGIGQPFVDSVRAKAGNRSVGSYAVDYPASDQFSTSTPAGAENAIAQLKTLVASCPSAKVVLGGYSQGAAVMELATDAAPEAAQHVAAIALFGTPRSKLAASLFVNGLPTVAPTYSDDVAEMCAPNDPVCDEGGSDWNAHTSYAANGMVDRAASFVVDRL